MKSRLIAAALLLNLLSWANSTAFCLSGLATMALHSTSVASPAQALQHPCCPQAQPKPASDAWTPSQPCEHGHRCCFVQNPQIPSNLPQGPRQAGHVAIVANSSYVAIVSTQPVSTLPTNPFRQPSELSTVLRN